MEWQDPRMIYDFIPGEKTYKNRTILTFDLEVLEKLWIPGKLPRNLLLEWGEEITEIT